MEYYELDSSQVIRHYDVTGKECPLYYVRHPGDWQAFLDDLT
jgi:N-acetylmuramoyl-L-alanine amidase